MADAEQPKPDRPLGVPLEAPAISVKSHPRASASIRRSRARAALAGLPVGTLIGMQRTGDLWMAGVVGLGFGLLSALMVWWIAVTLWRITIRLEVEDRRRLALEEMERRRVPLTAAAESTDPPAAA
jgi:hypothetical protein